MVHAIRPRFIDPRPQKQPSTRIIGSKKEFPRDVVQLNADGDVTGAREFQLILKLTCAMRPKLRLRDAFCTHLSSSFDLQQLDTGNENVTGSRELDSNPKTM